MSNITSKNRSILETKLKDVGFGGIPGDIGIEIELEGSLKFVDTVLGGVQKFWSSKPEGSLRGGVEYFLAKPVSTNNLPKALDEIGTVFDKCNKIIRSIRCSTHIHVNVGSLTVQEIYNVIGYYFLIEDILVNTQGPVRKGNLFCLRMSDAEYIANALRESAEGINDPSHLFCFSQFNASTFKYGALNLAALTKFGSLEFRFLQPMTTKADLGFWSGLFHTLVHKAKGIPLENSLLKAEELTPQGFLELVFPPNVVSRLVEGVDPTTLSEMVLQNYDHIWALSKAFNDKYLFIPNMYLMSDLSPNYGYEDGMEKAEKLKPEIPW